MQQEPASGHIRAARANLRLATQIFGAADLTRLQRAVNLLETTALEVRLAEAAALSNMGSELQELQNETAQLKREVTCLIRVIDGCAALHRGLAVRLGCASLTYTSQGRTAPAVPAAACEMQA